MAIFLLVFMGDIYDKTKDYCIKQGNKGIISKRNSKIIIAFTDNLLATGHRKGPYSEKRLRKYIYGLTSVAKILNIYFDKADKKDINRTVAGIRSSKWSNETIRDYLVFLKGIIRYIVDPDGSEYSIEDAEFPQLVKHIKPGRRGKSKVQKSDLLTVKDIKKLMDNCNNLRDKAFIHVLYESACRIGELIGDHKSNGLCIKDITFIKGD